MIGNDRQRDRSLVALAALLGVAYVNETGIGVALPAIRMQLGANPAQSHWIVNAYLLWLAIAIVAAGRLADLYGRRRVLGCGCFLMILGSAFCFLAVDVISLILGRSIQGLGTALIVPSSLALVSDLFPVDQQGRALGRYFGLASLFFLFGPLLTGELTQHLSWRWFFLLPLPLIALSWQQLNPVLSRPSSNKSPDPLDLSGLISLMVAISALVISIMQGNDWGWRSPLSLFLFMLFGLATLFFVRIEQRVSSPLLDLSLFRRKVFVASALIVFLIYFVYLPLITFLPIFLQLEAGLTPLQAAMASTFALAPQLLMSRVSGRLTDQFGARRTAFFLAAASVLSLIWLAMVAPAMTLLSLAPGLLLYGLASPYTAVLSAALRDLPVQQHGEGSALLAVFGQMGSPLGVAVVGSIVSASSQPLMFRTAGFQAGLVVCAFTFATIVLATRLLPGADATH